MNPFVLKFHLRNLDKLLIIFGIFLLIVLFIATPMVISHAMNIQRIQEFVDSVTVHGYVGVFTDYDPQLVTRLIDGISEVEGIEDYVVYGVTFDLPLWSGDDEVFTSTSVIYRGDPGEFVEFYRGSVEGGDNKIYVSRGLATILGISPGDRVTINFFNSTYEAEASIFQIPPISNPVFGGAPPDIHPLSAGDIVILPEDVFLDLVDDAPSEFALQTDIYVDIRIETPQTADIDSIIAQVNSILASISAIFAEYGVTEVIRYNILENQIAIQNIINISLVFAAGFSSIPYVFALIYLTYIALDLVTSGMRIDYGLMRLRGVSSKSLSTTFLIILLLIYGAALATGFFLGGGVSNYIASSLGITFDISRFFYSLDVVASTLIIGLIFIFIAYRKVHSRVSLANPIEVVRHREVVTPESRWRLSTGMAILYILSIVKLVEWLSGFSIQNMVLEGGVFFILLIIYGIISSFMEILAPIVFTYVTVNLALHRTNAIPILSKFISRFTFPKMREIVVRYVKRLPNMVPKTSFLMSLVFFLLVYYMVTMGTTIQFINDTSDLPTRMDSIEVVVSVESNVSARLLMEEVVPRILPGLAGINKIVALVNDGSIQVGDALISEAGATLYLVHPDSDVEAVFRLREWMLINYDGEFPENPWVTSYVKNILEPYVGEIDDVEMTYIFGDGNRVSFTVDGYIVTPFISLPVSGVFVPMDKVGDVILSSGTYRIAVIFTEPIEFSAVVVDTPQGVEFTGFKVIGVGRSTVGSPAFVMNVFMDTQRLLYPYSVYAVAMVMIVIVISTSVYLRSVKRDLAVLKARGMGGEAVAFAYSLIIPVVVFSLLTGVLAGFVAGYGGATSFIIQMMNGERVPYPISLDPLNLYGFIFALILSILLPLLLVRSRMDKVVMEVIRGG